MQPLSKYMEHTAATVCLDLAAGPALVTSTCTCFKHKCTCYNRYVAIYLIHY
jgi:hypothetical protein